MLISFFKKPLFYIFLFSLVGFAKNSSAQCGSNSVSIAASKTSICTGESVSLNSTISPAITPTSPTYTNNTQQAIPISNQGGGTWNGDVKPGIARSYITVTDCPAKLTSVCMNITVPDIFWLTIYLVDPCGNRIKLKSEGNPGGSNMTNTCFDGTDEDTFDDDMFYGDEPYSDTYAADRGNANWTGFVNGCMQTGTWELRIWDSFNNTAGTLKSWSLNFESPEPVNWSPATGLNTTKGANVVATPTATTTYTVTYTDCGTGCNYTKDVTITVNPYPTPPTAPATQVCNGQTATITATNTTAGSNISWFNATTGGTAILANSPTFTTPALGATKTYYLQSEKAGCVSTSRNPVTVTVNPNPTLSTSKTDITCNGANNGKAVLTAGAGTPGFTYQIDGGSFQGGANFTGLTPGNHTTVVKDSKGCTASKIVNITEPNIITPTNSKTDVSCFGGSNGTITVSATGGTGAYTYSMDGTTYQASNVFSGLSAGNYTVYVKDANDCVQSKSVTITEPGVLSYTSSPQNPSCNGYNNGKIDVVGVQGTGPYQFSIDGGAYTSTTSFTGLSANTYSIIVKDSKGCTYPNTITLTEPDAISLTLSGKNLKCNNDASGEVTATPSNGFVPYTYAINGGTFQSGNTFTGLNATTIYTITVKDVNNCTASSNISLTQPNALSLSATKTNANCFGATDGTLSGTASGGTTPYTYSLDNSTYQSSPNFSGLAANSYTVYVKDANNCSTITNQTITEPLAITPTVSTIPTLCNGDANGTITISATGGTGSYTVKVNGGAPQALGTIGGLSAGTYSLEISDANLCSVITSATINQPNSLSASSTASNVLCFGDNTGTISVTANGGNSGYQYSINGGSYQASNSFTNLSSGTYTLTIKDAKNCSTQLTEIVEDGIQLDFTSTSTPASCSPDGTISITPSNGTSPYTYEISTSPGQQAANTFTSLASGTYTITLQDANLCTVDKAVSVGSVATVDLTAIGTNPSCFNVSDGNITATTTGGVPPYQYAIDGGTFSPTNTFSNLADGTYTITVKDNLNCTASSTVTITQPQDLSFTANNSNVQCTNGSDGVIIATASGGNGGYTYSLDDLTYTASNTFTGLTAGNYTVYVEDSKACKKTISYTLTEPTQISMSTSPINPSCNGTATGSISISATGGTPSYTYAINGGSYTPNPNFSGLGDGTYVLTVKDLNGCIQSSSQKLTEPLALSFTSTQNNISCFNGADGLIDISAQGGTPSYAYKINGNPFSPSGTFSNLSAGSYSILVEDGYGCQASNTITLSEPSAISATVATTDVLCYAESNGTITVTATGGTGTLMYALDGGTAQSSNQFAVNAGTYLITVSDANGCSTDITSILVAEPKELLATNTTQDALCKGNNSGKITANANGGSLPYTYALDGATFVSTATFNNLNVGTYTITVKDANNCQTTTTGVIGEPLPLQLTLTPSNYNGFNVSCNGGNDGTLASSITGGTAPYTYDWSNGETTANIQDLYASIYILTVTDANDCNAAANISLTEPQQMNIGLLATTNILCNGASTGAIDVSVNEGVAPYTYLWSNGETTEDINNIPAGSYTLTATDFNGCVIANNYIIAEPTALQLSLNVSNVSCFGLSDASITSNMNGGVGPYTYAWSTGEQTQDITNIPIGTYSLTVTDDNNCTISKSETVSQPNVLQLSTSKTDVSCNSGANGTIDLSVSGGTTPYTYNWDNGAVTQDLATLTANTYTVIVTDANGCTETISETVSEPSALNLSAAITNVSCFGLSDGMLSLTKTGGTPAYTLSATNTSGTTFTTYTGLPADDYLFTLTDAKGCIFQKTFTVTQPNQLASSPTKSDIQCNGTLTGSININPSGGTPNYTATWTDGATGLNRSGLNFGEYTFELTDANGCKISDKVTILDVPPLLVDTILLQDVSCDGSAMAEIKVSGIGGTPAYQFNWSDGFVGANRSNLSANTYTLNLQDANGCITQAKFDIRNVSSPNFTIVVEPTICDELSTSFTISDITFTPTITVLTNPNNLVITGRDGTYSARAKAFDTYVIEVKETNEICTTTHTESITYNQNPRADFVYTGDLPLTTLNTNVQFINQSQGATSYVWILGFADSTSTDVNPNIDYPDETTGAYRVCLDAISNAGCSNLRCYNIEIKEVETVFVPNAFTPLNDDGRNEIFIPVVNGLLTSQYLFEVYDRWGTMVFSTRDPNQGWDGFYKNKVLGPGTFSWRLIYKSKDYANKVEKFGNVTILR